MNTTSSLEWLYMVGRPKRRFGIRLQGEIFSNLRLNVLKSSKFSLRRYYSYLLISSKQTIYKDKWYAINQLFGKDAELFNVCDET